MTAIGDYRFGGLVSQTPKVHLINASKLILLENKTYLKK